MVELSLNYLSQGNCNHCEVYKVLPEIIFLLNSEPSLFIKLAYKILSLDIL